MHLQQQQPPVPNTFSNIPIQHATGQQVTGLSQGPDIQPQYISMPPGPVRPSNLLLQDNDC
jgi:hypothetical protein